MRWISALVFCGALLTTAQAQTKLKLDGNAEQELPINWEETSYQVFCLRLNGINGKEYGLFRNTGTQENILRRKTIAETDPRFIEALKCIADPQKFLDDYIEAEILRRSEAKAKGNSQ